MLANLFSARLPLIVQHCRNPLLVGSLLAELPFGVGVSLSLAEFLKVLARGGFRLTA